VGFGIELETVVLNETADFLGAERRLIRKCCIIVGLISKRIVIFWHDVQNIAINLSQTLPSFDLSSAKISFSFMSMQLEMR